MEVTYVGPITTHKEEDFVIRVLLDDTLNITGRLRFYRIQQALDNNLLRTLPQPSHNLKQALIEDFMHNLTFAQCQILFYLHDFREIAYTAPLPLSPEIQFDRQPYHLRTFSNIPRLP